MDKRLYEAAVTGDVSVLQALLAEDAKVLENVEIQDEGKDNPVLPLHVAAQLGHLDLAREIIKHRREMTSQLNSRGQCPLHVACNGEMANTLLEANTDVCYVWDKDGRTPFHAAAIKGRTDVLEQLINFRSTAAWVLTGEGEPILHLCINYNQFEAFKLLVEKIENERFLKLRDTDNNTILHLLADKGCNEDIDNVLSKIGKDAQVLDIKNTNNCTALDLAGAFEGRCKRKKIKMALLGAGAQTRKFKRSTKPTPGLHGDGPSKTSVNPTADNQGLEDIRMTEGLMVVAILIATVTYTGMLSPPGGVWDNDGKHKSPKFISANKKGEGDVDHYAGQSIMSYKHPKLFIAFTVSNTVGFLTSIILILVLVGRSKLPKDVFKRLMWGATWPAVLSMIVTFAITFSTVPAKKKLRDVQVPVLSLLALFWVLLIGLVFLLCGFIWWLPTKTGITCCMFSCIRSPTRKSLFSSSKDSSKDMEALECN